MDKTEIRKSIRDEFEFYLSNVAKSSRITANGYNLQRSAVVSYLLFIEPVKLFDYAPQKWQHIESMYDIIIPEKVEEILNSLMSDSDFRKRDKDNNQGWRSGAIMHYSCFVKARSFFNQNKESVIEEKQPVAKEPEISDMLSKLLAKYREELPSFWSQEEYKWIAVKHFQEHWNIDADNFSAMFTEATSMHENLLASANFYPIGMVQRFAEFDEEKIRNMFRVLFDEEQDIVERIAFFLKEAEDMRQKGDDGWNKHYQDLRAISAYLSFMYPDKYFMYKFSEFDKAVELLGNDFSFKGKKDKPNFYVRFVEYMNQICERINSDDKLCDLVDSLIAKNENCYPDPNHHITSDDFIYYLGKRYEPSVELEEKPPIEQIDFSIDAIIKIIKDTGLIYTTSLIKRLAFSLLTKPFVILSGLAGSGKTQLALTFAKALVENSETQLCTVSVGADWTNREPLLGFPNALQSAQYVRPESRVLDLLIEANKPENSDKPYFLILDEMNMSYVERYFADFLSAMESKEAIPLWNGCPEPENEDDDWDDTPKKIKLPSNLFIIGTINVDETTYMFSPKVLDRANVIEFKISSDEMSSFLENMKDVDPDNIISKAANMAASFVEIASNNDLKKEPGAIDTLKKFFGELKNVNAEFGYRSATEIFRFICQAKNNDDTAVKITDNEILDAAIVQKLLPKLHGSRKKLDPVLKQLWRLCFDGAESDSQIAHENANKAKFKESADKIWRMYESASANGFTSFAEA